ncbi:MAG: MFS transporter [Candidatus Binatia bacterium]|nr:MFS transporter [Candidatus Binatia bacterium]
MSRLYLSAAAWVRRLGLERPEVRAWVMYDWANSAFVTTVVAAVFPVYFSTVAAASLPAAVATAYFATATTIALSTIALLAPFLGALADAAGVRKRLLAVFVAIGVLATAGLFWVQRGEWQLAAALFVVANIGASGSFIFYDGLLPHVARDDEMDRISAAGYALGYLGGGVLLAFNLAWIQYPSVFGLPDAAAAARLAFLSVAVWWFGFSLPLFYRVVEPPRWVDARERSRVSLVRLAVTRLGETLRALRVYKHAFLLLLAFLVYNDGIGTIIRMAAVYGTEIGLPSRALISAILLVQFIGIPCSLLFGALAERIGTKNGILLALVVYTVVSIVGYFMTQAWQFYLLAVLIGMVQGGSQALSRSLFARLIPRYRSSEFFAFFAICEKVAGIFGPALFAGISMATGSSRTAILAVILFFVVGGGLLVLVDVAAGQRAARAADAQVLRQGTDQDTAHHEQYGRLLHDGPDDLTSE